MTIRVAFLTTHPIQYQVPVFRLLAEEPEVELTVLYAMLPDQVQQGAGFGVDFAWDVPLLDGYAFEVLENVAASPSVTSFRGCDTPGIADVLRRLRLDALIVNGWVVKSCLQGLKAARRLGIPCLVRGEANNLRPRAWWKRAVHRQLLKQYARFLCIGEANREYYVSRGVPREKLFRSPYCIENDRFRAQAAARTSSRQTIRQRWGIPAEATCLLFCGKLEDKKHPVELLRAFCDVVRRGPSIHLLVVGDGELRARCDEIVTDDKLPVTFAGFLNQSEIVDAYVASDCLVLPSDHGETWGLVVNEAMACGRPAVVSDQVGCAADLIVEGETGHVFRFGDWNQLADLLRSVASTPEALKSMGAAAAKHIDDYSPKVAAEGIVNAVASVSRQSRSDDVPDTAMHPSTAEMSGV